MEKKNNRFEAKKIAIIGFGREGKSLLKYLRCANEIWILDKNQNLKIPFGIKSRLGKNYLSKLEKFDIVFRSPGVPYNLPQIQRAVKNGVEVSSVTKLFFEYAGRRNQGKIIGITGTKGKSTISALLYKILKACGKNAYLAGNIGKPALDILPKLNRESISVIELSSFQLQDITQSPNIVILTAIFPDHLDAHKNFEEYLEAKTNIVRFQKKSGSVFYFQDNKWSKKIAQKSRGKKIAVKSYVADSRLKPDGSVIQGEWWNKLQNNLQPPGEHNLKNATMAATVAEHLGCPEKIIKKTTAAFRGLKHRLEFVRRVNGVKFYNDSAGTNPDTTAAAVQAFGAPLILIAGGQDKNLNYHPLTQAIKKSGNVKLVVLFGENKNKIKKQATRNKRQEIRTGVVLCKDINEAVKTAYRNAKNIPVSYPASHVTILFSPGSASFDMFHDYADRGEKFKKIVKKLKLS